MHKQSESKVHEVAAQQNAAKWAGKPVLQKIYADFHRRMVAEMVHGLDGVVLEIGSGIGSIKSVLPACIRTDIFPGPGVDQVENIYQLSFADSTVSHIFMTDVFHHLRYPGTALQECHRVLVPGGRVIILEPYISWLGAVVYGCFHAEPISFFSPIRWGPAEGCGVEDEGYYAAQGNATRVFRGRRWRRHLLQWGICRTVRISALSHVLSGGYTKKQLFPDAMLTALKQVEKALDHCPSVFATRMMVVLGKEKGCVRNDT
jgi:SAM-dependent methyltransferase